MDLPPLLPPLAATPQAAQIPPPPASLVSRMPVPPSAAPLSPGFAPASPGFASMQGFGDTPVEDGHTLGLAILLTGIGSALGVVYGGVFGGIGGGLVGGSIVNGIRAWRNVKKGTSDGDREAIVSGTYAVLGAGAAVYLLYKGHEVNPNERKSTTGGLVGIGDE